MAAPKRKPDVPESNPPIPAEFSLEANLASAFEVPAFAADMGARIEAQHYRVGKFSA